MAMPDIVRIVVLVALGVAALSPGSFVMMLLLGGAVAGGLRYEGWQWAVALQAALAGAFCLPALRLLVAGRLAAATGALIGAPTLLIAHFALDVPWLLAAAYAVVLFLLVPSAILRTLARTGVLKPPAPPRPAYKPQNYSNFSSSAPSYPSRSEVRTPR